MQTSQCLPLGVKSQLSWTSKVENVLLSEIMRVLHMASALEAHSDNASLLLHALW